MSEQYINDYIRGQIKQRREALELSQEDLARAVGYSDKTAISKIERGTVKLDVNKLQAIAAALDSDPQDFYPAGALSNSDAFRDRLFEERGALFDLLEKATPEQLDIIEDLLRNIVPDVSDS